MDICNAFYHPDKIHYFKMHYFKMQSFTCWCRDTHESRNVAGSKQWVRTPMGGRRPVPPSMRTNRTQDRKQRSQDTLPGL